MTEWQPIETAPKDGTWVMLHVVGNQPDLQSYVPEIAFWIDDDQGWSCSHELQAFGKRPTHWIPLPTPPNQP